MWKDYIKDILGVVEIIAVTVVPAVYVIVYNIHKKITSKREEMESLDKSKRVELFTNWEYDESMQVTSRVRSICNYYKDQGEVDLVSFFQIENGTVARSKLSNMFVTCLAEDGRFGAIPKHLHLLQRVPYSQVASWIEKVRKDILAINDHENIENRYIKDITFDKGAKSSISERVKDNEGWLMGICTFEYSGTNYNGQDEASQKLLMSKFSASVTSTFINYHLLRECKLRELKLTQVDVEDR